MSKVDYEIVLANEEDRTDILSLYDMQKGREFCPLCFEKGRENLGCNRARGR